MKVESITGQSARSTTKLRWPRSIMALANFLMPVLFWNEPLPWTRMQTTFWLQPTRMVGLGFTVGLGGRPI